MRTLSSITLLALALSLAVSIGTAKEPRSLHVPRSASLHKTPKHSRFHPATSSSITAVSVPRGGGADQFVDQAYDWATNLGAPAALVAGAVIATLYENMSSGSLDVMEKTDPAWVKVAKKATRLLLLSAFILQIVCIFCTTILGTHLLSHEPVSATKAATAMQYLREQFEFEYLTSRIAFLQGLVFWLSAIALEHAIPHFTDESPARRNVDILIASSLATLIIAMMSFYNGHMNFYDNYYEMLVRFGQVTWTRYCAQWPPRVMTVLALPTLATSIVYFFKVFLDLNGGKGGPALKTRTM
ncbi:expressed unknown protein [Seminavis robusta]|uniref:Uncharacterized protein n=1 Tax=Seminavis robusta TaxID=568900 RepID=A0A9N8E537_9STRA|nr:expressed unknown protein [Seminavis robusta]|eukprot:Sro661_g183180.1 n/a (299) ;mRNA; f:27806-28875